MISFISITFGLGPHSYSFQVNPDRFHIAERSLSVFTARWRCLTPLHMSCDYPMLTSCWYLSVRYWRSELVFVHEPDPHNCPSQRSHYQTYLLLRQLRRKVILRGSRARSYSPIHPAAHKRLSPGSSCNVEAKRQSTLYSGETGRPFHSDYSTH